MLRQFQEHILETTRNAYSLEDTKKHVMNNSKYTSFIRKGRLSQEQADNAKNELDDKVNMGLHPYRCSTAATAPCGSSRKAVSHLALPCTDCLSCVAAGFHHIASVALI